MRTRSWILVTLGLFLMLAVVSIPFIYTSGSRTFREVSIPAEGYQIAGSISESTDPAGTWIVFTHGNRKAGQAHPLYQNITNNLDDDLSILTIDFRGFGASSADGMVTADHVLDRTDDIEAATAYLESSYGTSRQNIILIGHSLGALQVLKAGQETHYGAIIAMGPANFEVFLDNGMRMSRYIQKFEGNTGVEMTNETILLEGSTLTPLSLFSPCPLSPVTLVFGARDHGDIMLHDRPMIDALCPSNINWLVIPLADHMYGTEIVGFPKPVPTLYSTLSQGLLKWQINQLLP